MAKAKQLQIPEWAIKASVNDCLTVKEFADKYRKPERYTGRGTEYAKAIMQSHYADIKEHGYTAISHHDSIVGKFITFIPTCKCCKHFLPYQDSNLGNCGDSNIPSDIDGDKYSCEKLDFAKQD